MDMQWESRHQWEQEVFRQSGLNMNLICCWACETPATVNCVQATWGLWFYEAVERLPLDWGCRVAEKLCSGPKAKIRIHCRPLPLPLPFPHAGYCRESFPPALSLQCPPSEGCKPRIVEFCCLPWNIYWRRSWNWRRWAELTILTVLQSWLGSGCESQRTVQGSELGPWEQKTGWVPGCRQLAQLGRHPWLIIFCSQITAHLMTQENTVLLFCARIGCPPLPGPIHRSGFAACPGLCNTDVHTLPPTTRTGTRPTSLSPLDPSCLEQKFSRYVLNISHTCLHNSAKSLSVLSSGAWSFAHSRGSGNICVIRGYRSTCVSSVNPQYLAKYMLSEYLRQAGWK